MFTSMALVAATMNESESPKTGKSLQIRSATIADAPHYHQIADQVRYQAETADGRQGFLVTIRSSERYAGCIETSPCALIAFWDANPVGMIWTKPVSGEPHSLWVEQIGVVPSAKGQGVAQLLLDRLKQLTKANRLGCEIYHQPILNQRSRGFFMRNGFCLIKENPGSLPESVMGEYWWQV
jgi:N-acetylglutamate synthase-like GNAT family acetyltransferase